MKRAAAILVACAVLSSCGTTPVTLRPALDTEGLAFVYLQPLPEQARRLGFRFEAVSVVSETGETFLLDVLLEDRRVDAHRRERLLARGPVPRGTYAGLALRLTDAILEDAVLQVAEGEIPVDVGFTVGPKRSAVVSLRFHERDSVEDGFRFAPDFSAEIPGSPASGLIGLATSREPGVVTVFDKVTGRVATVLPVGRSPGGMAIDSLRLKAYVALPGEDAVEVLDLQQLRPVDRVRLLGGDRPVELSLTPDRMKLLSVNAGSDSLSVLDPLSLSETNRIQVGNEPASVVVDRSGRQAYVFNTLSDTVSLVDLATGAVASTFVTDAAPSRGQLDRQGSRLYVIHRTSPYLTVVDVQSLEVLQRVYVGSGVTAIKVDPRTDRIYLARRNATEVEIYDPFSLLPVDSIPVESEVAYMTIDDEGNNLGLVLPELGQVRILRLVSKETIARIDLAGDPLWLTFLGER